MLRANGSCNERWVAMAVAAVATAVLSCTALVANENGIVHLRDACCRPIFSSITPMSTYLERIAKEWHDRAGELAQWTMDRLVNRTDVWGRYVKRRDEEGAAAVTAPFRDERGKVFLDLDSLVKHFRVKSGPGALGVHAASADRASRWLAIDIDLHEPEELSVTKEGNFVAARGWWQRLIELGFDPLLTDSNGQGGFHVLTLFAEPLETESVHAFGRRLVADFAKRGLDVAPEIFPDAPRWEHYGDWLRLPGRHHTRSHYTRVWNDEPYAERPWLEGNDAIDRLLATRAAPLELCERHGLRALRRTICLDFDGVLHSYRSGWCGADVIPDPPIHGTAAAVTRLRKTFRVVVHSARCRSVEGRQAIAEWLQRNGIEVDEVCEHKPPAAIYVDDRAVPFRGNWDQVLDDVRGFRR